MLLIGSGMIVACNAAVYCSIYPYDRLITARP